MTRPVVRVFVNTAHAAHPWGSIVSGILRYAKMSGWTVQTSFRIENAPAERRRDKSLFRHYRPDGIITTYCEGLREALPADIPVVWLDPQPGHYPEKDDCIFHDNEETARLAARELLSLQVPHYAAVGVNDYSLWSTRRINVFRESVLAAGKTFRSVELNVSDRDTASRYRLLEPFLLSLPKPCALFAVCDALAIDVISIAARLGIEMPKELAVIGVDNIEVLCESVRPSLSSIASDWENAGYLAASALDKRLRGSTASPQKIPFREIGVIRRGSTLSGVRRVDARVVTATAYIRQHACEDIGVDDVVRQMKCSRRLAEMRFQEVAGRSIFAEIREARFERALVLLAQPNIQIGAIAGRCGWRSATAFRAYFEHRMGMSLQAWRMKRGKQGFA